MTARKDYSVWFVQRLSKFIKKPVKEVVQVLGEEFKSGPPEDEPHKEGKGVVQKLL